VHPSEQETSKRARHKCFVSHETGLAGGLYVSVSQVETKHLDFQGSFGFRFNSTLKVSALQEIILRISPDHGLVGAITEVLIGSGVRVQIHGDPVQLFAICLFSVPTDPTSVGPH